MLGGMMHGLLQSAANQFLTERCDLQRDVATRGAMGEVISGWTTVAANVPCRFITAGQQTTASLVAVGGADSLQELYRVALPSGTVIDIDMRLIWNGASYDVVKLEPALTDEVTRTITVSRRR